MHFLGLKRLVKSRHSNKFRTCFASTEETDQSGLGTSSCNVLHPPKTDDSTVR